MRTLKPGPHVTIKKEFGGRPTAPTSGTCMFCGCTQERACPGGCTWVNRERTICSACGALGLGERARAPKKESTRRGKPEHQIQRALFGYIHALQPLVPELALAYAPKNDFKRTGNAQKDFAQWAYLQAEGVQAGVPDVCIPVPAAIFHGFYLELKAPGNSPTDKQLAFLELLRKVGYFADWTDSLDKAIDLVGAYLAPLLKRRREAGK